MLAAAISGGATAARDLATRAVVDWPEKRRAARSPDATAAVSVVAASAHEGAGSLATPATGRIPPDRRECSLRAVFRVIETARLYGSLRETSCRRPATPW